jgi:hypothetical protein
MDVFRRQAEEALGVAHFHFVSQSGRDHGEQCAACE